MLFGFPTEMWVGMAAFWPALALAWTPGGAGRAVLAALAMAITALSHEAGLLWVLGLAVLLVSLVHAVETTKFIAAWRVHLAAVQGLVMGAEADPALGDAAFVSTARLPAASAPLAWHSTAPFLGALAAPGYAPARLLVDPGAGYFWFDCAAATTHAAAARALPQPTREMLRRYTCLHR